MGVSGRCWGNLGEAVEGLKEAVGSCVEAAGGCGEVRGVSGSYGGNLGEDVEGLGEAVRRPHGFQGCRGASQEGLRGLLEAHRSCGPSRSLACPSLARAAGGQQLGFGRMG